MRRNLKKPMAAVSLLAVTGLVLAGCGDSVNEEAAPETATSEETTATEETTESTESTETVADCGDWAVAMHGWVGYTASAQVVADVARDALGCTIEQTQLEEAAVSYDAMEAG